MTIKFSKFKGWFEFGKGSVEVRKSHHQVNTKEKEEEEEIRKGRKEKRGGRGGVGRV
jgi:hypothetical protein